jgi:hypothetical protein
MRDESLHALWWAQIPPFLAPPPSFQEELAVKKQIETAGLRETECSAYLSTDLGRRKMMVQ